VRYIMLRWLVGIGS